MSAMFLIEFAVVLLCILIGARLGGIGLGVGRFRFGNPLFWIWLKTCRSSNRRYVYDYGCSFCSGCNASRWRFRLYDQNRNKHFTS